MRYWWNKEVDNQRIMVLRKGTILTRLTARNVPVPEVENAALHEYKVAKKELRASINRSKRECWKNLLQDTENDLFGEDYKIIIESFQVKQSSVMLIPKRWVDNYFPKLMGK